MEIGISYDWMVVMGTVPNKLKESDLAAKIIVWLEEQHYDVYQEVKFHGKVADIVAVRFGIVWVIETKTTLSLDVLRQADEWQVHKRSIGVPVVRKDEHIFAHKVSQMLNVGVLEVGEYDYGWGRHNEVNEVVSAPLMRQFHKFWAKELQKNLLPEHKYFCKAGSSGGGYYTPYKQTMEQVRKYIADHPGCTTKELMDNIDHHYSSDSSARSNIPKCLSAFEKDWCEVKLDGRNFRYFLKEKHA